ncbi:hypothetical protein FVE85_0575 [Porphyridium purpureum]|uniref:Uncharacterized protein n=1 Tax=Porphyridium purpureum TaxID=35688 RepID=A0A5J4YZR2_PORPP|nr:hypothetical protein FVE85_0575 [Porphyridium purpureum]|eukprot:POR2906..scf208_2
MADAGASGGSEDLVAQLAAANVKIEAMVAHHEKTKTIYTQLADMYEKLRVEYASALKRKGELSNALAAEKATTAGLQNELDALRAQNEQKLRDEEKAAKQAEQETEAVHVDVDDLNEDMMMPVEDGDEEDKQYQSKRLQELEQHIVKLEGDKTDLHALLDEVEKELEAEQEKMKHLQGEMSALRAAMEEKDRETEELRRRASRSIGVRELEELVATKVRLAELQGERIKLLHELSVLTKRTGSLDQKNKA